MQALESAPVGVFWDFENAAVPTIVDPCQVAGNIKQGLRQTGLQGLIYIAACGNTAALPLRVQRGLHKAGIVLRHVPPGEKEAADRTILLEIGQWERHHQPPGTVLLISGDGGFAEKLSSLDMNGYNVLLACPSGPNLPPCLRHAARVTWDWRRLAGGEVVELFGSKHPAHLKPLNAQPTNGVGNHGEDIFRPVPAKVKEVLQRVLSGNPEGLLIDELLPRLVRDGNRIHYRALGYPKLLPLLRAMPDVVCVMEEPITGRGRNMRHRVCLAQPRPATAATQEGSFQNGLIRTSASSSSLGMPPRKFANGAGTTSSLKEKHPIVLEEPRAACGMQRADMTTDLRGLLTEVLPLHPMGYSCGLVKGAFFQRFKYPLNQRELGYEKLSHLLASMPDIVRLQHDRSDQLLFSPNQRQQENNLHVPDRSDSPNLLPVTDLVRSAATAPEDVMKEHTLPPPLQQRKKASKETAGDEVKQKCCIIC